MATAIQLKRHGIQPVILEKGEIGGLLKNANLVENYPGFPDGISGLSLIELFERQLAKSGARVSFERVLELEHAGDLFLVKTDRRVLRSSIAVIASGTKPKRVSDMWIARGIDDRIFYEVHPIRGVRNKKVAIIGAGDAAFDYALGLSKENDVVILNRSAEERCIPLLKQRCVNVERFSYRTSLCVREVKGDGGRLVLSCLNGEGQKEDQILADYVVIAAGREPCLDFLGAELKRSLKDLTRGGKLYLVGDVKNEMYRQTAICVGDGVKAAMRICRKIRGERS
jgi:thioredoxin reductase